MINAENYKWNYENADNRILVACQKYNSLLSVRTGNLVIMFVKDHNALLVIANLIWIPNM